jgi:hypothetical protein
VVGTLVRVIFVVVVFRVVSLLVPILQIEVCESGIVFDISDGETYLATAASI